MRVVARSNQREVLRKLESWSVGYEMRQRRVHGASLRASLVMAGLIRPLDCLRLDAAGVATAVRTITRTQPRERWCSIALASNDSRIAGSRRLLAGAAS